MNDNVNKSEQNTVTGEVAEQTNGSTRGRRRFIKGAAGVAPIIMTVASRPVLANNCSVSGAMSGNVSQPGNSIACMAYPASAWAGLDHPWTRTPYDKGTCAEALVGGRCENNVWVGDGTSFHDATKGFVPGLYPLDKSMIEVMLEPAKDLAGGPVELGPEAVAALLNAFTYGEKYGYSVDQIQRIYARNYGSRDTDLVAFLQWLNNGRPLPVPDGIKDIPNI